MDNRICSPKEIHHVQTRRLIDLNFHQVLGMSASDFASQIPLPKEGKKAPILVISQKVISISNSIAHIEVDGKHGKDFLGSAPLVDAAEARVPQAPFYWRYGLDDGKMYLGYEPVVCLELFYDAERLPGTANEAIYVIAQHPEILKDHYLDCAGSQCHRFFTPCLNFCDKELKLQAWVSDEGHPEYGSFSFKE